MIIVKTKRLHISKIVLKDAAFFLQLMNTPGFLKYIGDRNIKTIADAKAYLKSGLLKSYKVHGFGYYKLTLKEEPDRPIGIVGILKRDVLEHPDVGFALLPEYERLGYSYEASIEILKLAKDRFNLKKITAITNPDNDKSIKLLEKLGLKLEQRTDPFNEGKDLLLFGKAL
ncbi:GNAT family N-acetyltransferase [Aestuariivivens sediminis]|uniref:GNAT family N-acetyltransferase n=1 Tax=Aestuariivivens sediminis TaxID=2913557 RepID=UPI001F59F296|nr:GNAT family N-acetyltransferase [Aestuariivivens sediminis]